MRIEDFSPQPLKGHSVNRASDAHTGRKAVQGGSAAGDEVLLSGSATLAAGTPSARLAELHTDVAEGTYHVPSEQVSRNIVEYYLS